MFFSVPILFWLFRYQSFLFCKPDMKFLVYFYFLQTGHEIGQPDMPIVGT